MTKDEALDLALKFIEANHSGGPDAFELMTAIKQARSAPVQESVAFKIYKPTPPRGAIPDVRDAELPWVYDQDPSSGNVASMWVTPVKAPSPVQEHVAWGVFEGGNLHDMFFSKEAAEHMALLKGSHAEVRPLYTTPPADGYDKVLQAIKEARPAVAALKDKPVSWWLDRFEEFVKQLKEKNT